MSNWIYRVGLSESEVNEGDLKKSLLPYAHIEVEKALREHIAETVGKAYKFYTSMRLDAPDFFSCSSLMSYLYTFAGVWMPSVVIDKYFFSKKIEKGDLQFGDFIFSHKEDATGEYPQRSVSVEYKPGELTSPTPVSHMGMYMGDGTVLHASPKSLKGMVVIEPLDQNSAFGKIVGYGRVVDNLKEKRFVVEIPENRPDLRAKENLIKEIQKQG